MVATERSEYMIRCVRILEECEVIHMLVPEKKKLLKEYKEWRMTLLLYTITTCTASVQLTKNFMKF